MTCRLQLQAASCLALVFFPLGWALATDWPQYAGPNGDGSSSELIRTNWAEKPPQVVWRKTVGPGFSSVVASGGRVFTQIKRAVGSASREFCVALDGATGDELWATDVDVASYTDLVGYDARMDGPRSTPSVDGDRVYVFTSQLRLFCLRTDTGKAIWSRDFVTELGSVPIAWENAASPLLVGDLILVNANATGRRLMAVRKSDGGTVWSGQNDVMTHATPVFARIENVPQVIFLTRSGFVSIVPESGVVLWRFAFSPSSTSTAASPGVSGNYVHGSAAYGSGTWIARVTKSGNTFSAVQTGRQQGNNYQLHWSTPVEHNGFLYCVPSPSSSQGRLSCVEAATGINRWVQTTVGSSAIGYGSLIKAGDVLVVLTEGGEVVLVKPNPAAYEEVARFKPLTTFCWNRPSLSNGRLYARSTSALKPEIVSLDIGAALPPLPPLGLAAERSSDGNSWVITVRALDGSELDASHVGRLELVSTVDLVKPMNQWAALTQTFAVSAGKLVTVAVWGSDRARYVRARERN